MAGLFTLVFFLRLWLVREWGSPLPYWDQWDSEALKLFRPWLDGSLRWTDLVRAANEHRIVLTRLIDLGLLTCTGHWDTWGQLTVNAALNAATPIILAMAFWETLATRRNRAVFTGLAVALFATPSSWQNALWGIQSICYLINALTCIAVIKLLGCSPFAGHWWFGFGAALLALFTQASGVFAVAAVAPVLCLEAVLAPDRRRRTAQALMALGAIAALAFILRAEVPAHDRLRAGDIAEFWAVFSRCLSWPFIEQPLVGLATQAPFGWLLCDLLRRRRTPTTEESCALALGLVTIIHAGAIAITRGGGLIDHLPLSRYHDSFLPGTMGALVIVLGPISRLRHGKFLSVGWIIMLLLGLGLLAAGHLRFNLPVKELQNRTSLAMITDYVATGDPAVFERASLFLRPHPDPRSVVAVLDDPVLRPILPPECRGVLGVRPWLIERSPWLAAVSATILLFLLWRPSRAGSN